MVLFTSGFTKAFHPPLPIGGIERISEILKSIEPVIILGAIG
jgi:hypothetical protein